MPVDGYVLLSPSRENELIIHPVLPEMANTEIRITYVVPNSDLMKAEYNPHGLLLEAGDIIGM